MFFTIILFLFIMLAVALIFSRYPKKMVLFVVAFSPIINLFWFVKIFGFSLIDAAIGVLPIIFLFPFLQKIKYHGWVRGRFFTGYLMLFSAMIVPCFYLIMNEQFMSAAQLIFKLALGLISYQIFLNFFHYQERWKLVQFIFIAAFITVVIVAFQVITGFGTGYSEHYYLTGFYADVGTLSRMALFGIIVTLPFKGNLIEKKNKLISKLILLMSILILILAISRNAILAGIAIILVYSFLQKKMHVVFLVFLISAAAFFSSEMIQSIFHKKISKEIRYLSGEQVTFETLGSGRIGRWKRVLEEFKESDTIQTIFGTGKGTGPHGQFFDLLRRTGIYGLIVVILYYLKLTLFSLRILKKNRGDPFPFYSFLLLVAFWVLFLAATPLYDFYMQILIFGFIAFLEKGETYRKLQLKQIRNNQANQSAWSDQK